MWGGRKLAGIMGCDLPGDEPIGEAWILSDRDDYPSRVADGPFRGRTLHDLSLEYPEQIFGPGAEPGFRYPLLLKFLDAREMLSVQVHPSDAHRDLLPPGERGKTEAWLVLDADPDSRIYAGIHSGTSPDRLREDLALGTVERDLASFHPKPGDGVFIPAGTIHALGGGVSVFEVQQNSDVTFRLYDWNRVDAKTGTTRELHVEQALACIDYERGPVGPVEPQATGEPAKRLLFASEFFTTWRIRTNGEESVGADGEARVIVCLEGQGKLLGQPEDITIRKGEVWLLPAEVGPCRFKAEGATTLLEIATPPIRA